VPTTLLAVDDSVTMRKVLEMTFAGEDFRVVTAEGADAALAKLRAERPAVVLCDVTLDGVGGYGLCAKIKADNPAVAVVLLASKQQPYDSQKGGQARADDYVEKPFDTQQLLEKVKRLAQRPAEAGPVARTAAPSPPAQPAAAARPTGSTLPMGVTAARPPVPAAPAQVAARPAASSIGRGTLAYGPMGLPPGAPDLTGVAGRETFPGPPPVRPAPPGPPPAPQPSAATAQTSAVALASPPPAAPITAGAVAANGQLATQLTSLGLTEAQVTAVLALSREVIEKVVWEVVPVLAETLIQEEIRRLTRE
jgi:CheY-like chemotaxis protein